MVIAKNILCQNKLFFLPLGIKKSMYWSCVGTMKVGKIIYF